MKKKTYGLTILMLKPEITTPDDAVKDPHGHASLEITIGAETGKLYYKQNPSQTPKWVKIFEPTATGALANLFNSGTAAAFVIRASGRFFALTFGYGKFLLKPDCYEENFGLRTVLNSVDPDKLRSIDVQSLDAVPLNRRSQSSVATALTDFGLDIEQDLVYAATGQPKDPQFGKQLTGKDALKISIPLNAEDIPGLLSKLATQYEADNYKASFAWVDHLSEVRTKALIERLDAKLSEKIQAKAFDKTWLSIPEIIEWSDISGFRYQKPKQGGVLEDIGWDTYLESLGAETPHTTDTFKKQYVFAISESSGQQCHAWPAYKCIYCELSLDGADYALNNGKWFKVNSDFLSSVNDSISAIPSSTLTLPVYQGNNEGAYNEGVCSSNPTYFALMDKKMIQHGGGHSKIEFCDLFTTGASQDSCRLIHAANRVLFSACSCSRMTASRSGLSVTAPIGDQLRVFPDQRAGLASRAWRYV